MRRSTLAIAAWCLLVAGCPSTTKVKPTDAQRALTEVPEEELLDVAIGVFDPGIPEGMEKAELNEKGIYPDIRKSESRYMAYHLKATMETTGNWGAVRVVPAENEALDLLVTGTILESNGETLEVEVRVVDATGRVWLEERYEQEVDQFAYESGEVALGEPYQDLYNKVSNDILEVRRELEPEQVAEIRRTAELRFAEDLAPDAFAGYLAKDDEGRHEIVRLPARDDPMMTRIGPIQERDHLLLDTLNEHYAAFYAQMEEPYTQWRTYSYEEQVAMRELKKQGTTRTILGGLAILGAIIMDAKTGAPSAARDVAVLAGAAAIKSGLNKRAEAKIHSAALSELAASFDSEVSPMLVEVEDHTLRLQGSAETQYDTWRKLLRGIFASETGLPLDPNTDAPAEEARVPGREPAVN